MLYEVITLLAERDVVVVAAYWPIRGEPDLRPWMRAQARADRELALRNNFV